jgi:hypothetical protein
VRPSYKRKSCNNCARIIRAYGGIHSHERSSAGRLGLSDGCADSGCIARRRFGPRTDASTGHPRAAAGHERRPPPRAKRFSYADKNCGPVAIEGRTAGGEIGAVICRKGAYSLSLSTGRHAREVAEMVGAARQRRGPKAESRWAESRPMMRAAARNSKNVRWTGHIPRMWPFHNTSALLGAGGNHARHA